MPYKINKKSCKQSDGDSGSYVLSYTDKKGKKHNNCHTSKKKAQGQIAAIEGPREMDEGEASGMSCESPMEGDEKSKDDTLEETDDMVFGGADEEEDELPFEEELVEFFNAVLPCNFTLPPTGISNGVVSRHGAI